MIHLIQRTPPVIDFGLGSRIMHTTVNTPVTVWLQTLYNEQAYTFTLAFNGVVTKVSNYEYRIFSTQPGTFAITLNAESKQGNISLNSNLLTLNVTE